MDQAIPFLSPPDRTYAFDIVPDVETQLLGLDGEEDEVSYEDESTATWVTGTSTVNPSSDDDSLSRILPKPPSIISVVVITMTPLPEPYATGRPLSTPFVAVSEGQMERITHRISIDVR